MKVIIDTKLAIRDISHFSRLSNPARDASNWTESNNKALMQSMLENRRCVSRRFLSWCRVPLLSRVSSIGFLEYDDLKANLSSCKPGSLTNSVTT